MKVTYEEIKDIVKTLPIGYYLGRKVKVVVEPGGGAKCDVVKNVIYIGLDIINIAAEKIGDEATEKWSRENLLRCVLYHEVGHLLLSPKIGDYIGGLGFSDLGRKEVYKWFDKLPAEQRHAVVNIFEDERIECILDSAFFGVEFKRFCRLVNGDMKDTKCMVNKLINVIRLRRTTPEMSNRIDDIIFRFRTMSSRKYTWVYGYLSAVFNLAYDIVHEKEEDEDGAPKDDASSGGGGEGDGEGGEGKGDEKDKCKGRDDGEDEDGKGDDDGGGDDGKDGEKNGEGKGAGDNPGECDHEDGSCKEGEDAADEPSGSEGEDGEPDDGYHMGDDGTPKEPKEDGLEPREIHDCDNLMESIADTVFAVPGNDVTVKLNQLARRLAKRKGLQACGRWSALHGKIDTRRDALDKERIFRRSSDVGNPMNSMTNLVLWVDVSGSFAGSTDKLNSILSAAYNVVGICGKSLNIQLVKMGDFARVAGSKEWEIFARDGNSINRSYYETWKKTRMKNTRNIDIVVFDGDAKSDDCVSSETMPDGRTIESVIWNSPDCFIVTDATNRRWFDCLTRAHVTYVYGDYAEHLENEFVKIVDRIV